MALWDPNQSHTYARRFGVPFVGRLFEIVSDLWIFFKRRHDKGAFLEVIVKKDGSSPMRWD